MTSIPAVFGPDLPKIRDWTEEHFDFSGYITGFTPPTVEETEQWRSELGYAPDEKVCIVTVGGSGVGRDLLEKVIAAYPMAKEKVPELRMVAVAGPRIDPESLPSIPGSRSMDMSTSCTGTSRCATSPWSRAG